MKQKKFKFIAIFTFAILATVTLSSYVADGEDDGSWRAATGGGCDYYCWYQDNNGSWYSVKVSGSYTSCPKVTYSSSCTTVACSPIVPCSKN